MGEVRPMPAVGDVFTDVRAGGRTMRVSHHPDQGVVVVSLWAGGLCRGSFRLAADDAGRLAELLGGLPPAPTSPPAPRAPSDDAATSGGTAAA
jgi:hypothetical protein